VDKSPDQLVASLEKLIAGTQISFHKAYWDAQVEASPENDRLRAKLELELREIMGDQRALDAVQTALSSDKTHDPVLRRQLEVLKLALIGNQMDADSRELLVSLSTSVESDFASFRPSVDGNPLTDNQIEEVLKSSDDVDLRRRTWLASKEVGAKVADRVRELARVRNSVARDLGFADYYAMSLELEELDEDWLFDVMDGLESLTEEPFKAWKSGVDSGLSERFGTEKLYPWHYADPFFQSLPREGQVSLDDPLKDVSASEMALRTFSAWDMDIEGVLAVSDIYPRDLKSQHAFCIDIDREGDVRILANVVPGERWIEVMLHESGHAAFDIGIDKRLPYLIRTPAHTFVTEAIAILSGRLVRNRTWLERFAQVGPPAGATIEEVERANAYQSMLFARWGLVMVHFERALYADPEGDLDAKWWDLVERFQLVARPPDGPPPGAWAAKIHVAAAPVYYQNYLLGEMLASQLIATARRECGEVVGSAEAGRLISERIFRPGNLLRWDALVEEATGRPLDAADFGAYLRELLDA
jgi:peptidyl-dipeptidase A